MAEYLFRCVRCQKVLPLKLTLKELEKGQSCPFCGLPLTRLYTPPIVWGETVSKDQASK